MSDLHKDLLTYEQYSGNLTGNNILQAFFTHSQLQILKSVALKLDTEYLCRLDTVIYYHY